MRILHGLGRSIRTNVPKILAKATGVAALGMVAYDANYVGKMQADLYASERDAANTNYYLNNTMYSDSMSKLGSNVKDAAYKMELDQGWRRFFNVGIGYVKGFTSMLINHVVPLGLGLGALLTKGKASKGFALATVAYGLAKGVKNFFGIGTPPNSIDLK